MSSTASRRRGRRHAARPAGQVRRALPSGRSPSVEAALRLLETVRDERLDGVRRAGDDRCGVVLGRERREDEVGDVARVAATRAADADPQPEELGRAEPARDRAQAVVAGEPAAEPGLQPADVEIDLVVDDEQARRAAPCRTRRAGCDASGRSRSCTSPASSSARRAPADAHLREVAAELALERAVVPTRELVDDHEADVVAVALVPRPGFPSPTTSRSSVEADSPRRKSGKDYSSSGCGFVRRAGGCCRLRRSLGGERLVGGLLGLGEPARARAVRDHGVGGIVEERDAVDRRNILQSQGLAELEPADVDLDVLRDRPTAAPRRGAPGRPAGRRRRPSRRAPRRRAARATVAWIGWSSRTSWKSTCVIVPRTGCCW